MPNYDEANHDLLIEIRDHLAEISDSVSTNTVVLQSVETVLETLPTAFEHGIVMGIATCLVAGFLCFR